MIKAIIIDDEMHCRKTLGIILKEYCPEVQVMEQCSDAQTGLEAIEKFKPDLVFLDIEMPHMNGFEMLQQFSEIPFAVVFTTGYDQYAIKAFRFSALDYLLKPVCREDLNKALEKYKRLEQHFTQTSVLSNFLQNFNQQKKTRLLVKKGLENISLLLDDVVLFFTENKIVYVIDKTGRKYLTDKNLSDLEADLDNKTFFRVNRQYIINIHYIRSFKAYERVKLQIELTLTDLNYFIVVSQETAPLFRKWISES